MANKLKIISWNANSINARYELMEEIIKDENPDLFLIQESRISGFGFNEWIDWCHDLGYDYFLTTNTISTGQGGVLILAKKELSATPVEVKTSSIGRVHAIKVGELTIVNTYVNQGQEVGSVEYSNKLILMKELAEFVESMESPLILAGDFNICPEDHHVWSTSNWHEGVVSRTPPEISAFNALIGKLRNIEPEDGEMMSWYGYRHAWRKVDEAGNRLDYTSKYGIKCDHILASEEVVVKDMRILGHFRFETKSKPSDHIPLRLIMET